MKLVHILTLTVFILAGLTACMGSTQPVGQINSPTIPSPVTPLPSAYVEVQPQASATVPLTPSPTATPIPNPMSIAYLRQGSYPGSPVTIEENLAATDRYRRYIASYQSEGLKIYALLTVPYGKKPASGWPVIIFNHGYIPPSEYKTTQRYVAYVDAFARAGYIVFKPDYRGHGESQGTPSGPYTSPAYTIDVLNALASIKQYADADPARIGMWGHSMGGQITMRCMVTVKDIKAGVIWGGVVAPYPDLFYNWRRLLPSHTATPQQETRRWGSGLASTFGDPLENPDFWASISPNTYLGDLSGPVQLHHGLNDETVPFAFSQTLYDEILEAGKISELYLYKRDNHNISENFKTAIQRSVEFFDRYVK
jgi:dipeptidyl aminopeptidase/acylaminoacyl peptidase